MEIQVFKNDRFGEVRTMVINDEPWFVGKDVAEVLGYKSPSVAICENVDSEDKTTFVISESGSKYKSKTTFINESGLYALILSSKLPQAKEFKRWVTSEVLPQIRKTGAYLTQDFCMRVLNAEGTVTTTQIAQDYGMTAHDLNQILVDMKLVYPCGGQLVLYARYKRRGYAKSETELYARYDGKAGARMVTRWTQTGRMWLYETLKKKGVQPTQSLPKGGFHPPYPLQGE
jgi:prophage antirepressor-like protein